MNYNANEILAEINYTLASTVKFNKNKYTVYADISYGHNYDDPYDYALIDIYINDLKYMGVLVNQD